MKIFIEYKGQQYGYIFYSKDEKEIDYLKMMEVCNRLMKAANILTPELDNFIQKLGEINQNEDNND